MNKMIFLVILLISFSAFSFETTPTGISLDKEWKVLLNQYAKKSVVHQSWGYSHSERNYQNTVLLANSENIIIDLDVLFAAAFLHELSATALASSLMAASTTSFADLLCPRCITSTPFDCSNLRIIFIDTS